MGTYLASLAGNATALDRIMAALGVFTSFIQANRPILLATFQLSTRRGLDVDDAPARWLLVALREMLRAGIETGEIRDVPTDATARAIIGVHLMGVLGVAIFKDRADDQTLPGELETIARMLLEG